MRIRLMLMGLALAAPAAAQMAMPTAACTASAPAPAGFEGWALAKPVGDGGTVVPGQAAALTLVAAPHFAVAPGHAPKAGTFGAAITLTVPTAGTYRVGTGSGVWIDMVQGTTPLASVAHDHGPACSPVRKLVDFHLTPGRYVLQLSGAATSAVTIMVAKVG